jgi:Zn-dependent protease
MDVDLVRTISIFALPLVFAITLHEAAHGYVAKHFGDLTAYAQGRVSLNPLRHVDLVGTLIVPMVILTLSHFAGSSILFGWAKPVPVNFGNLRNPKRDMRWVAAAGPGANFVMALFWAATLKLGAVAPDAYFAQPMIWMGAAGILVNVALAVLNLMPLLPLDGGRIVVSLLPPRLAYRFSLLEPYGMVILLVLLFTGVLGLVLWPIIIVLVAGVGALIRFPDLLGLISSL